MPARPAKEPLTGPDWIHEIKHDGFRITGLAGRRIESGYSPAMVPILPRVLQYHRGGRKPRRSFMAVLDGEAIVVDEFGLPNFDALRYRLHG